MLETYTQVCWVVHDLERKITDWIGVGAGPFFLTDSAALPEREYRGSTGFDKFRAAHGFLGNTQIELIQPTSEEPSAFREVLDRKGEAIHHIQPKTGVVDGTAFNAAARCYKERGFECVQTMHVPGIGRIVFFDALEQFGFFFELAERPPRIFENTLDMYRAHMGWDGKEPIRINRMLEVASQPA